MIVRNLESEPEVFFIERAHNVRDPWSGQIALPGGNREPRDGNIVVTAQRETREEVGIILPEQSLLARLDDLQGRNNNEEIPLIISCFVFHLDTPQAVRHSSEVGDSFWISVEDLLHSKNQIQHQTIYSEDPYPGIQFPSGKVLWGLTYRFVQTFLTVIRQG
jgi:8-oxo-dGTP pyrophosphatase MutT (NUDIX family)